MFSVTQIIVGPVPTADASAELPEVTLAVEPNAPTPPTIPAALPPQPLEEQNQAPKDVMLDGSSLSENDEGAVVGTITVFDPDSDGSHQFEVSDPRLEIIDGQYAPGVAQWDGTQWAPLRDTSHSANGLNDRVKAVSCPSTSSRA